MADISVEINGIKFKNPVMPAAGPNVRNARMMLAAIDGGAGGIVSKTVSIKPADDKRPTIRKAICRGLVNSETWSELPIEKMLVELAEVKNAGVPLIVSIGYKPGEVAKLGELIENEIAPDGFEFSTHYTGKSIEPLVEVARSLRSAVEAPIWMKISPNTPDIEALAIAVSEYVDAFVAINSFGPVLDFDIENPIPELGSDYGQGWLSGPPILPIALRIVYQILSVRDKPVIGVGGISKGVDAIKFIMAGASAVQVCSAAIRSGHSVYGKIAAEIGDWLETHGYSSIEKIGGLYKKRLGEQRTFDRIPVMSIDPEKCTGCKACIERCIQGAIYMKNETAAVIAENCIGCGFCQDFCPQSAMQLMDR